ncbi:AtpZ/AtpI family protein [Helicobacter apodemus]|uniref:AtpZ/AtpI family protein n=1 Tax=Helicobacter apodemus TaxID=135569 RepID=A0A4U8UGH6_9HELI|nr:AtpZ/AtpI family protein [Helicobacter apodemus]TLE16477.1 AtpZ/AtpI family protein [Helicobacter apodemus]
MKDKERDLENKPKYKDALLAYSNATLGISMVVAVLIGVGVGYGLKWLFGYSWLFWLGVVWGILAAILNVYKAYKSQKREFDALSKDPKYAHQKPEKWEEDEDN